MCVKSEVHLANKYLPLGKEVQMNIRWEHKLSTLTVVRTIKSYIVHPKKTFAVDQRTWGDYFSYRKCIKNGLAKYYNGYPKHSIPPEFYDLFQLYTLVRNRKPEIVMELGGGCSTIALSYALKRNYEEGHGAGKLYSIEESKYWQGVLRDYMPSELTAFCEFLVRPVSLRLDGKGEYVKCLEDLPQVSVNLLYIDGGGVAEGVEIEKQAPSDYFIVVDGRALVCRYLNENLSKKYRYEINSIHSQSKFELVNR